MHVHMDVLSRVDVNARAHICTCDRVHEQSVCVHHVQICTRIHAWITAHHRHMDDGR